ncbi:hypothetical protein ACFWJW_20760 [Streptomyces sp. NPDC127097]|uniref:hypothetical protein n=1 Tax=Streptomyces sp. NPDC127097 TaxID=3347136 RepID=UPI003666D23D
MSTACTSSTPHPAGAPAAKPGAAGVGDRLFPSLGNGGYDVAHYSLTMDYVLETNHLKGTAVITARATQDLSRFNLDFAGLKVRSATVNGTDARFARKKNELTLTPTKAIKDGETFKAGITYDGTPRMIEDADGAVEGWIETDDGSAALGQPTGSMAWFPGNHHPSDKATYDMTVTVPKDEDGDPYDVIGNGELTKEVDKGDRVTRHWRSKEPMASYLANVTVGYFEITQGRTDDGLPVYLAVDPDETESAEGVADLAPEVTDWASKRFGPYPFSSTGAIVDHLPDSVTRPSSASSGPGPRSTVTRMPIPSGSSRCARGNQERTCPRSSTPGSSTRRSPQRSDTRLPVLTAHTVLRPGARPMRDSAGAGGQGNQGPSRRLFSVPQAA